MSFSSRPQQGFTLLEMIVVMMLVSLIAALLMQGFMYMAGIYSAVDRRQQLQQDQRVIQGWLGGSVRGVINGIDGSYPELPDSTRPFSGDAQGFDALGMSALSNAGGVVRPLRISWTFEQDPQGNLSLVYLERRSNRDAADRFVVRSWPAGSGRISYFSEGEWHDNFPPRSRAWDEPGQRYLPELVRLQVDATRGGMALLVRPGSGSGEYRPPRMDEP